MAYSADSDSARAFNGTWTRFEQLNITLGNSIQINSALATTLRIEIDGQIGASAKKRGLKFDEIVADYEKRGYKVSATGEFSDGEQRGLLVITQRDGNTYLIVGFIFCEISRVHLIPNENPDKDLLVLQWNLASKDGSFDPRSSPPAFFLRSSE